jgi:hypothetical protein
MHSLSNEGVPHPATGWEEFLGAACPGAVAGVHLHSDDAENTRSKRSSLIREKQDLAEARADFFRQTKGVSAGCPEKKDLYDRIRRCSDEGTQLQVLLDTKFLPQHGLQQIISPRAFLESRLFRVGAKNEARLPDVHLDLSSRGASPIQYRGPELRQSDALVFSGLLHMARDVRPGLTIFFLPEQACRILFGRYDGNSRRQLQEHIERLQRGLVRFDSLSVQLCLRFEFPRRGCWSVALDADIVEVFRHSPHIWLELPTRVSLSDGLATWLYGYVRCQTTLIPTKLDALRALCGSSATPKAFMNGMRRALGQLAALGVIRNGWSLGDGKVRWMKGTSGALTTAAGNVV